MAIIPYQAKKPLVHESCFIAPDSWIIGDVKLGQHVSVFFGSVLRGDIEAISVGDNTNIREHSLLHTSHGRTPCIVGAEVTIGHRAIIHGCTIGDSCIIGMGATILDEAVIPKHCIVGANSLVTEGKTFPERSLILGSPAKAVRPLTDAEILHIAQSARGYVETGKTLSEFFLNQP
jgi:carbonic anhydrase/acetyltransferase-like protein (isoleucine patch superfamily)